MDELRSFARLAGFLTPLNIAGTLEQKGLKLHGEESTMYAIAFDLDTERLKNSYPSASYNNAYTDIRNTLTSLGFEWKHGSVYFGTGEMNAVECVLAAQKLSQTYPWFKNSVRDILMLRIEDVNDLLPAL